MTIAAALQESGLDDLDHGDRDSLGLVQQRSSQGWDTPAQIMNPTYAATQFYQHLLAVPGWQQMSVDDAAQAAEHSGFPDGYAQHEQAALDIVAAVAGTACAGSSIGTGNCAHLQAPNAAALAATNFACGQLGLPYVWGGNGPADGDARFDRSGLTHAAGDFVFYGNGPRSVTHVGIAISPTQMIDAPDSGADVEITGVDRYRAVSRPTAGPAS